MLDSWEGSPSPPPPSSILPPLPSTTPLPPPAVSGVVYVVDPGMVKQKHYQPGSGMDSLDVVPISRVQAAQRAGRAGRTRAGKVRVRSRGGGGGRPGRGWVKDEQRSALPNMPACLSGLHCTQPVPAPVPLVMPRPPWS